MTDVTDDIPILLKLCVQFCSERNEILQEIRKIYKLLMIM